MPSSRRPRRSVSSLFDPVARAVHVGGWPARLLWRLGLQPPLRVEEYDVRLAGAVRETLRLKVAFASDFHAGLTTHPSTLRQALEALNALEPDVLLLGGDFVSLRARYIDDLARQLGEVHAPCGRFAVMGNHDLGTDERYIVARLESAGIEVLTNRNVGLRPPFDRVWICGLDDPRTGRPDAASALRGADGVRIVIMHSPDGLLSINGSRFELALCGHTHGGQVALPSGRPLVLPRGELCRRYCYGRFPVGPDRQSTLIVTCGVGNAASLPIRLNAPPEVVSCTITIEPGDERAG